ncbi:helix-turn-helix transcriptional regulator [Maricaulis sp.]|uniref:helix-turn-helix transcriptional regulator n=1 Tax=Maricaulis sp. TaxID=1486257 RepID=UPI003A908D75
MSLKTLRLSRGWSQSELAQICDLSERTIQRIEGGRKPGLEALKALASSFDMTPDAIERHLATPQPTRTSWRRSGWRELGWHGVGYVAYALLVAALVSRFDADSRIAAGISLLGAAALLIHLAIQLLRTENRRHPVHGPGDINRLRR